MPDPDDEAEAVPEEESDGEMQAEKPTAPRTVLRGAYWNQLDASRERPATQPVEPEETADDQS